MTESSAGASPPDDRGKLPLLGLAMIVIATFWAYWPCLSGGFFWDDNAYVRDNALLLSGDGLWRIWFEPTATPAYHPLVFTSFWIEQHLWGLNTFGYHAVNVALHAVNSLLLWAVLRRLTVPGALFAAALFALHPVHVESVAWISERKDVLSACFYGLTVLTWLRYLDAQRQRDWLLTLVLAALTLLSKSVLCTLPLALALLAWWKRPERWRQWSLRLLPLLLLAALLAAVTVWREHAQGNLPLPYSMLERLLIACRALWTYAAALVWPLDLTVAYEPWSASPPLPSAYLFAAALVILLGGLVATRSRFGNGPLVAVAFFVITLAPMLGLVDFNIMQFAFVSDHFQYVASAGLIALIAAASTQRLSHLPAEQRNALAAVVLLALTALSWRQAALYADAETMWRDNLAKNPRSWTGHSNLAAVLARANQADEALLHLQSAVEINPNYAGGHLHLGIILVAKGQTEEALDHFRTAMRLDPSRGDAANNLGTVLMTLGRVNEADQAFAAAVHAKPEYAEAWRHWAIAAARLGQRDDAITRLREAIRLKPDFAAAQSDLQKLEASH